MGLVLPSIKATFELEGTHTGSAKMCELEIFNSWEILSLSV